MSGLGVERVDEGVRRKWWGGEDWYEPRKPKVGGRCGRWLVYVVLKLPCEEIAGSRMVAVGRELVPVGSQLLGSTPFGVRCLRGGARVEASTSHTCALHVKGHGLDSFV
ncbi:MAG: hypothetical protein FRX48_09320 [Lasallia pustulata]|uniref:Uncharacterized protein n=1 Tax=Lasallia pustulata TaxID=136370 RepID=A0A5M8PDJ4_9LECA|nr:MAG: hypothetical protein FRX48_09320 [Lasallia pustulata]